MAVKSSARKGRILQLQNTTDHVQSVFDTEGIVGRPGKRYDIPPYQVVHLNEKLAGIFLETRGRYVVEFEAPPIPNIPGDPTIWVANGTGNPFVPKTVTLTRIKDGEEVPYEVPNPLSEPVLIKRTMKGNQRVVPCRYDANDKETIFDKPIVFEIPPYSRVPMSSRYAYWNLERDARQEDHHRGKLVSCRAPTDFEPNSSWKLEELRAWANMTAPSLFGGRKDLLGDDSYSSEYEEEEARLTLYHACYFVTIDDLYAVPTEDDFLAEMELSRRLRAEAKEARKAEEKRARTEERKAAAAGGAASP